MIRQNMDRIEVKRRGNIAPRQKQFVQPIYKDLSYDFRLNFYANAPTKDITLEEFETWAIDRLRGMSNPLGQNFRTFQWRSADWEFDDSVGGIRSLFLP